MLTDRLPHVLAGPLDALWHRFLVDPVVRRYGAADTEALLGGRPAHLDAESLVAQLLPGCAPLSGYLAEFEDVDDELRKRAASSAAVFPEAFRMEREGRRLLYLLVRLTRPQQVVETGVANGMSTVVLLNALEANGGGRLRSLDLTTTAGGLLTDQERAAWELSVVAPADPAGLQKALDGVDEVDLFLHDSKHSYDWQRLEYEAASRLARDGALLVSDDVDASYAWVEFVQARRLQPAVLFDGRKFVGAAVLRGGAG